MVSASELTKYFGGKRALGPVSFEVGRGETIGFLGLNGAGKTTLLRILAGDIRPSGGRLTIDGADAVRDPLAVRRLVGFLPELPPVYPDMPVREYLRFSGRLRGMDPQAVERRLPEVEELTHLRHVADELIRNLSQGYRQRVGLAQAVIHEPELLILDEPTHDLDPAQIVEMRALLGTLKSQHTIFLSSHNLPEISQTCDRLFVVEGGEIIASGTEEELSARLLGARGLDVTVRVSGNGSSDPTAVIDVIRGLEGIRDVVVGWREGDEVTLTVDSDRDRRAEVCRVLVESGFAVVGLQRSRRKLESIFLDLVRGADGAGHHGHSET